MWNIRLVPKWMTLSFLRHFRHWISWKMLETEAKAWFQWIEVHPLISNLIRSIRWLVPFRIILSLIDHIFLRILVKVSSKSVQYLQRNSQMTVFGILSNLGKSIINSVNAPLLAIMGLVLAYKTLSCWPVASTSLGELRWQKSAKNRVTE